MLNSIFFRPTFTYGEGNRQLTEAFYSIANEYDGDLPHFEGSSNGLHQYVNFK